MGNFEITDNFYLDGKPFQIISGAIHYFRIVPEYWQDRLEKLKAMVICDFKTVAVHLCGVGIWRTAGVAVSGRWNETARFLSAVFKTCAGLL